MRYVSWFSLDYSKNLIYCTTEICNAWQLKSICEFNCSVGSCGERHLMWFRHFTAIWAVHLLSECVKIFTNLWINIFNRFFVFFSAFGVAALVCVITFKNVFGLTDKKRSKFECGLEVIWDIIANHDIYTQWAIVSYGNSWLISKPSSRSLLRKKIA